MFDKKYFVIKGARGSGKIKPFLDIINRMEKEKLVLVQLISGAWVDCKSVQDALGIDFGTGLKMFDFGRIAKWNPPPLNGQKIETNFRLKTPKPAVDEFVTQLLAKAVSMRNYTEIKSLVTTVYHSLGYDKEGNNNES